jgi:hypothetical protein
MSKKKVAKKSTAKADKKAMMMEMYKKGMK